MVDVNSGSDTRVLVKQVLEWEKNNRGQAQPDLQFSNELFVKLNESFQEFKDIVLTQNLTTPLVDLEAMKINSKNNMVAENSSDEEQENQAQNNSDHQQYDKMTRLQVLSEKILELQNSISTESGSNFCTDES